MVTSPSRMINKIVPNALHFIDKYNQVPRILNPMVLAIEGIDRIAKDPFIYKYIDDAFGGIDTLKKSTILSRLVDKKQLFWQISLNMPLTDRVRIVISMREVVSMDV